MTKEEVLKNIDNIKYSSLDETLQNDYDILINYALNKTIPIMEQYAIKDKFQELGLDMRSEIEKYEKNQTELFISLNPEILEVVDLATRWWISAIEKPYFYSWNNNNENPIEIGEYLTLTPDEKKIEKKNQEQLTEERKKIFKEELSYEIIDEIRKNGQCRLKAEYYPFGLRLNNALEKAGLRVIFPTKIDMIITKEELKINNAGRWTTMHSTKKEDENTKSL